MDTIVSSKISMAGQRVTIAVIAGDIINNPTTMHKEPFNLADQIQGILSEVSHTTAKCSKKLKNLNQNNDYGLGLGS